jgi:hypothetical protein
MTDPNVIEALNGIGRLCDQILFLVWLSFAGIMAVLGSGIFQSRRENQ